MEKSLSSSKNPRITVPFRVQMGKEIMADGLGNTLSKNTIQNFEDKSGSLFQIYWCINFYLML